MTKDEVKAKALEMANTAGLINLTRRDLCEALGIHDTAWSRYFDFKFTDLVGEISTEAPNLPLGDVTRSRVHPSLRKQQILNIATALSEEKPYYKVTRAEIAEVAKISESLITGCYGTMKQLRRDVIRAAIKQENPVIIAQGLAAGDSHAKKAPPKLRAKAAKYLSNL